MSILIKGMEMPTYEQGDFVLCVRRDGRVDKDYSGNTVATAVPVPPHGRLIDVDAFIKENEYFADRDFNNPRYDTTLRELVGTAPTIIPAEEVSGNSGELENKP